MRNRVAISKMYVLYEERKVGTNKPKECKKEVGRLF